MSTDQALVYWGGLDDFISATMAYTPGISPNVATVVIPPQDANKIFASGPLQFRFGSSEWTFQDCRLASIRSRLTENGNVFDLTILDRRWKWSELGRISGFYNVRENESIKLDTEKTPHELAILCLSEMQETNFDISQLPNDARPEIDWDYTRPAEALAALCDLLGCMIVLGLDNSVRVHRKYIGALLPTVNLKSGDVAIRPPDPPGAIAVACGRTRYQVELPLEPVGKDVDGSIKPIDLLSYAPIDGWENHDAKWFTDFPDDKAKQKKLAQESVYRWFRIKTPFRIPTIATPVTDVRRILPIESTQVEQWTFEGRRVDRPAWLYGEFWDGDASSKKKIDISDEDANLQEKTEAIWQRGFSIDAKTGVVKCSEQCYDLVESDVLIESDGVQKKAGKKQVPPRLWLRAAVSLREMESWGWRRYEVERIMPGPHAAPNQTRYYKHDDLACEVYTDFTVGKIIVDNKTEISDAANFYLDQHVIEYNPEESLSAQYTGLRPLQVDGAIWQVGWTIQGGIGTTTATRNRENLSLSVSLKEKRLLEKTAQEQADRNKPQRQLNVDAEKEGAPN